MPKLSLRDLILAYAHSVDMFTSNDVSDNIQDYSTQSVRCVLSALKNEKLIKNVRVDRTRRGNPYLMKAVK